MVLNSKSFESGFKSSVSTTFALRYGSSCKISSIAKRFLPCKITVMLPSGNFNVFRILATVPNRYTSFPPGTSTSSFSCATTPIVLFPSKASLINLIDLSRPAVIGITTPGNNTMLRKGNILSSVGISSLFIASSSS